MNAREGGRELEGREGKELTLLEEYVMIDGVCVGKGMVASWSVLGKRRDG
jgi:hypothetical protein